MVARGRSGVLVVCSSRECVGISVLCFIALVCVVEVLGGDILFGDVV